MRTTARITLITVMAWAACGGKDGVSVDASAGDSPLIDAPIDAAPAFALTSPAFSDGMTIPAEHTCDGVNTSPVLAWPPAAGARSYSLVFTDMSNALIHWVIYDIPATAAGLPADVDKVFQPPDVPGARQTTSFSGNVRGYLGPCPPNLHTYQFALYALDVDALPGASMNTTRQQAEAIILDHDIAKATLTGTYMRP